MLGLLLRRSISQWARQGSRQFCDNQASRKPLWSPQAAEEPLAQPFTGGKAEERKPARGTVARAGKQVGNERAAIVVKLPAE